MGYYKYTLAHMRCGHAHKEPVNGASSTGVMLLYHYPTNGFSINASCQTLGHVRDGGGHVVQVTVFYRQVRDSFLRPQAMAVFIRLHSNY